MTMDNTEIMQIILATIPTIAGVAHPIAGILLTPVAAAASGKLTKYEMQRQQDFLNGVLAELKEKWNEDIQKFLESEEGQYIIKRCWQNAVQEQDKLKRMVNINILTNVCNHPKQFKQIDYYHSVLISLAALEVHILAFLHDHVEYYSMYELKKDPIEESMQPLAQHLKSAFPDISKEEITLAWKRLYSLGLVNTQEYQGMLMGSESKHHLNQRLTAEGKSLIKYGSKPVR